MNITNKKTKLGLLFTSATILVPRIGYAQTTTDLSELDKLSNQEDLTFDSKFSTQPNPIQETSPSVSQPELAPVEVFNHKGKAADLILNNTFIQPETASAPELSTIQENSNLEPINANNSISQACSPINIEQPEFSQSGKQFCKQDNSKDKIKIQPDVVDLNTNKNFTIPPRSIQNEKNISIFTTNMSLNGTQINHLTKWQLSTGANFADKTNAYFDVNGLIRINSQLEESLTKDNIFTVEQRSSYIQFQTARKKREITVNKIEPRTVLGTEIQLSMIGSCLDANNNAGSQCTYLPGLVTDKSTIPESTLFPSKILQNSKFGDVVSPESVEAMKQPGFQKGANGDQYGIDLYFPNAGSTYGNAQSNQTSVSRTEDIENTLVGIYSNVRRIVRANHKEAVIGRTVRGFGAIAGDKNALLNSAFQLTGLLLPDADPQIEGSDKPYNKNINVNLFFAANNTRIPANSYTFYHSGIGKAKSPYKDANNVNQIPAANFDSIWIGVSPVKKYTFSSKSRYELTSPAKILSAAGAEGGLNSNINIASNINGQNFSNYLMKDFYSQIYLQVFSHDANFHTTTKFIEETNFYPHISITGNITTLNNIWKYYGGMIGGEKINAYVGTDFTQYTKDGWTFSGGAIGYTNPDNDYYSQVLGNVSKKISLGKNSNLVLSTGFNYAIDRKAEIDRFIVKSPGSSVTLGARANLGDVSLGLVNYFGALLPNSIANTLLADVSWKLSNNFLISGYYTPINESNNRSRFGASARWKLGDKQNSPILSFGWNNNEYNLGSDPLGNKLGATDNVFSIMLKFAGF